MEYWTDEDIQEAKANGIKYITFYSRINDLGMSVEEAKNTPIKPKRFSDHIYELAKENGVSSQLLHARINAGWEHVRAATQKTGPRGRPRKGIS